MASDAKNTVLDWVGTLLGGTASIIGAVTGNPTPIVNYGVNTPVISGLAGYANANGSAIQQGITGAMDYADSYLANSQTVKSLATNAGTSAVNSFIGQYKTLIIGVAVVLVGLVVFKSFSKR